MHPHLPADVGENLVTVVELDPEHRIGEGFHHNAFQLDGAIFLGQSSTRPRLCTSGCSRFTNPDPHRQDRRGICWRISLLIDRTT